MKIEIYGKDNCPNCETAKNLTIQKDLPLTYYKMDKDFTLVEMFQRIGKRVAMFPQIFVDDKYVGSLNEFKTFLNDIPSTSIEDQDLSDFEL